MKIYYNPLHYKHSEDKVSQAPCNVSVNNVQLATVICSLVVV